MQPDGDPTADVAGGRRRAAVVAAERLLDVAAGLAGRREDALAIVNGAFGDALADAGSPLAVPMTIRTRTHELRLDRTALTQAIPEPTRRIAVFVHGLMSTESVWGFAGDPDSTYGSQLSRDRGVTPLWVRYNTGRHISTNGRELASLLHRLVAVWPRHIREITLVGHSMGGLVIRSACHYASATRTWHTCPPWRRSWRSRVRRIVLIGVPNAGAPLEVFANRTSIALGVLPIHATRLIGTGLDARSAGIKDLRFGSITDEDWLHQDPRTTEPSRWAPTRPLRRARYLIVSGSVTADPDHPVSRAIGDTLVTPSSAAGIRDSDTGDGLFPGSTVRHFPKVTHIALASRPEVYQAIDAWWARPTRRASAAR